MRVAFLVAAALVAGCQTGFAPEDYVSGLRVLGVKAEPPEVMPGQSTTVRILAVDPKGRAISFDWAFCLATPPPQPGGINADCASLDPGDGGVPLSPIAGSGSTVTTMLPPLQRENIGTPDGTAGFYLPVRILSTVAGDRVMTIYPLRLGLGLTSPNHNPVITDVAAVIGEMDGGVAGTAIPLDEKTPYDVPPGGAVQLRAILADGAIESFTVPTPTGPEMQMERVDTSWFATAGDLGGGSGAIGGRRYEVTFTPSAKECKTPGLPCAQPAGTVVDVWVVARDDRGGADWAHRTLRVH